MARAHGRPARGDGGATFVQMAVDNLGDRLPDGFRRARRDLRGALRATSCALYREGECTLVHGDPHLGNLFVDSVDGDRTGFLDWAVIARAPGIRDVAYVLCNSMPTEVRRAARTTRCSRATASSSPSTASRSTPRRRGSSTACSRLLLGARPRDRRHGLEVAAASTSASAAPSGRRSRAVDLDCVGLLAELLGLNARPGAAVRLP